mmetsp:Transcript_34082/g.96606  ORF Transcript_34082/g.96606 Transcript_34082/m.96606 type:complete len:140 (+) Transcript_34082:1171-1590(+)
MDHPSPAGLPRREDSADCALVQGLPAGLTPPLPRIGLSDCFQSRETQEAVCQPQAHPVVQSFSSCRRHLSLALPDGSSTPTMLMPWKLAQAADTSTNAHMADWPLPEAGQAADCLHFAMASQGRHFLATGCLASTAGPK